MGLLLRYLPYWKHRVTIPIPTLMGLVRCIAANIWRGGMRTQRGKVQEAGKDDNPEAFGVDNVATVDLGAELPLDIQASGCGIKQITNQKPIR